MKRSEAFPSTHLKASDVEDDPIVTIKKVRKETFGQGEDSDEKTVMYFEESDKGMVVNVTRWDVLETMFNSDDTDDWIGEKIQLYAGTTLFKGKTVATIGIKAKSKSKTGTKNEAFSKAPAERVGKGDSDDLLAGLPEKTVKYLRNRKNPAGRPLTPMDEMDSDGEDNPYFNSEWVPF